METKRRDILKGSALAVASYLVAQSTRVLAGKLQTPLRLQAAGYPYDHVKALIDDRVGVDNGEVDF